MSHDDGYRDQLRVAEERLGTRDAEVRRLSGVLDEPWQWASQVLEALPVAVLLIGETGAVVAANRRAGRALNVPHAALPGKPFVSYIGLSSRPRFRTLWHEIVTVGGERDIAVELAPRDAAPMPARVFLNAPPSPFGVRRVHCVVVPDAESASE